MEILKNTYLIKKGNNFQKKEDLTDDPNLLEEVKQIIQQSIEQRSSLKKELERLKTDKKVIDPENQVNDEIVKEMTALQ